MHYIISVLVLTSCPSKVELLWFFKDSFPLHKVLELLEFFTPENGGGYSSTVCCCTMYAQIDID